MDTVNISTTTQFCAVIGNPIGHSLSPAIHNAAFAATGLDFVYLAFRIEDVAGVFAGMRAIPSFRGMSITIPHKVAAIQYVDEVEGIDRKIGSINTVIREGDRLIGFGTDGPGALKALRDAGVEPEGKRVLLLGSGGAARAVSFSLAFSARPAELALLDIQEAMLGQLAADLREGTGAQITSAPLTDETLEKAMSTADIIIHCTPVGMHPKVDASLIPADLFRPGQVVFDIVYTPLQTKLLADAQSRGLTTISGVEMFVNQAALQFERFAGVDAPVAVMRKVVLDALTKKT
ncbi:MAG: shikimate dehydrogenase [Armatimonadota bacterium]